MLAVIILGVGIISRIIIHVPNFTPIIAVSLFSGTYVNKKYCVLLPLGLMVFSDLIIGFHNTILFTWGTMALITFLGLWLRQNKNPITILGMSLISSVIFFIITKFGSGIMPGLDPPTWEGLQQCYILAIPFFRATLLSTVIYSFIFFGAYEFIAHRVKGTKLARVLLTV